MIVAADDSASETPADNGQFVVRRVSGDRLSQATVAYSIGGSASAGADYAPLAGSVTLPLFIPEVAIDLQVSGDDGALEGDETVTITLLGPEGGSSSNVVVVGEPATATIVDSPHSITVSADTNATENPPGAGRITASLGATNASGADITLQYSVAGTATAGADYEALSGSAIIPAGSTSASIDVTPLDDNVLEPDETVEVTLTTTSDARAPVGNPASASVTIADDDAAGDDDSDGLSNVDECPDFGQCRDTDQDALPDYQDPDDDGDGVPTTAENAPAQDTDSDDTPDYLDDNDDGDNRLTIEEDANTDGDGDPSTDPTDLDGDDVPDYLDADDQGGPAGDPDGDGLTNEQEEEIGTDPILADTDGDGVNDGDEDAAGTDPLDGGSFADADGDLVPDAVEDAQATDPNDPASFTDTDGGGTADHVETIIYASLQIPATSPVDGHDDSRDLDGDGLPDRLEIGVGGAADSSDSPTANGAADDTGNGVTNAVEAYLSTLGVSPVDAQSDFDRDGYPDAAEVAFGLDPLSGAAIDDDGDSVPNAVELRAGADIGPTSDTDADGVPDAREIAMGASHLDANSPVANGAADDDGDGVSNAIERALQDLGVDGIDDASDGDGDGLGDADEIRLGTDPLRDEQPVPWIELSQAPFGPVRALSTSGGTATAKAFVGGHQSGLSWDWSGSSSAVLAVVSGPQAGRTLTFAPATLPPGVYNLVVEVKRTIGSVTLPASIVETTVNVIADAEAAAVADADNDGIPDSSDDSDGREGFANALPAQSTGPITADAGVRLVLGSTARATQGTSALVTREDIAAAGDGSAGNSEDAFEYLGGIYDFEVTNLPEAGSTVRIVIPQAGPIGSSPEYRKFLDTGWSNFVENANNIIESAAGGNNECPPAGDSAYQPGLTPGHLCVQLTIEDGGPNDGDADAGANGVIKDPGGVGTPESEVVVGQGSGSSGPAALVALGLLALWGAGRRRLRCGSAAALVLAGCCLCAIPPAARADGFVGAGGGLSNLEPDTTGTPFSTSDNQDFGYKVFGGVDLTPVSPNLSVEVFWADLGQATLNDEDILDYSAYGAGLLYGIGSVTAPRLSATVEAGVARLDISGDLPFRQEEDTSLFMSVAGSFAIRRHLFLQLEYEYFAEDAQLISLSIVKRFRMDGSSDVKTIPLPDR